MPSFKVFDIAGSGLSAQSVRLNTVASNLANADSISGDPSTVYRARHPVFQAVRASLGTQAAAAAAGGASQGSDAAVRVAGIVQNNAPPSSRYEPGNPLADSNGYVYAPNVNIVEEMVDMISASRAYQNNVEVLNTSKDLMLATLKLGQS
jgi:flagellar basal-body rod protein FlgC